MNDYEIEYNKDVDYSSLKQHQYSDQPGVTFYTCPRCGREYLASFFFNEDGQIVCIDCSSDW